MPSQRMRTGVCVIRVEAGSPITIRTNTDVEDPGGETVEVVTTPAEIIRAVRDFLDQCTTDSR